MKNQFSIPQECHSRQDATAAFKNIGISGVVKIGILQTGQRTTIVWQCTSNNRCAIIPVFCQEPTLEIPSYAEFHEIEDLYLFIFNQKFYCIEDGEVYRVDILFCEDLATEFASIILDEYIETASLCSIYPQNNPTAHQTICWQWTDSEDEPHFHPVFEEDEFLFLQRCRNNPQVTFKRLEIGDFFERNGSLWQIISGQNGTEITLRHTSSQIHA